MQISSRIIAQTPQGEPVFTHRIVNDAGASIEVSDWGARLIEVLVPDKEGRLGNVVLCPPDLLTDTYYMGAVVGRVANRIGDASFLIDGQIFTIDRNDGCNSNHGGFEGFDRRLWHSEVVSDGVKFTLTSPDGDGGYPGRLDVCVTYSWTEDNRLQLSYEASTDFPTLVNLTHHAYFNLGVTGQQVVDHWLQIPSDRLVVTDENFIPTGEIVSAIGTPFDFTVGKMIGKDINADSEQLRWNRGYNHCYLLPRSSHSEMHLAARLQHEASGRYLEVNTTQPAVLVYSSGFLPRPTTAVCIETQCPPDAIHHSEFPSRILRPEMFYRERVEFSFGVME